MNRQTYISRGPSWWAIAIEMPIEQINWILMFRIIPVTFSRRCNNRSGMMLCYVLFCFVLFDFHPVLFSFLQMCACYNVRFQLWSVSTVLYQIKIIKINSDLVNDLNPYLNIVVFLFDWTRLIVIFWDTIRAQPENELSNIVKIYQLYRMLQYPAANSIWLRWTGLF